MAEQHILELLKKPEVVTKPEKHVGGFSTKIDEVLQSLEEIKQIIRDDRENQGKNLEIEREVLTKLRNKLDR